MIYRFDDVEIDVPKRELRRAGDVVAIEPMVLDVIVHLVRHAERVVPKTELLDELWGDRFVSESALTSRIKSARRALGDDGRSQRIIRTVHGHGYRFVAPLDPTDPTDEPDEPDEPAPPGVAATVDTSTIRFVEGRGGVFIAVAETGAGRPLVKVATWMTHVGRDTAASPIWGHWVTALSRRHRYVRYDPRGCGLSDRDLRGIPLDDLDLWVDDLTAVIDTVCGEEPVDLLGISQGGPVAVALAARRPERVAHLVLFGTYARGMRRRDQPSQDQQAGLQVDLARVAWSNESGAFREVFARLFVPEAGAEEVGWFNDQLRLTTDGTTAPLLEGAFHHLDVSEEARDVTVPTLVLHAVGDEAVPFEEGRRLAGLVPGARFVPLHSRNHILLERDAAFGRFVEEIDRFTAT